MTSTAAKTAGDPDVTNLVRVQRGRVLINLGRFPEAAAAVSAVPTGFQFENPHSTADARTQNAIKGLMWDTFFLGMGDTEGTNGLDYVSAGDPRVSSVDGGVSEFDLQTQVFRFVGYESSDSPVPLATGAEARLIQAEAALRANDVNGWLARLNEPRAAKGMAPLLDPGTAASRVDLTFRERAFWLYGTAHRLGDLRRLIKQYDRGAESVFPTGDYHKDNLQRANQVALVVPQTEENNPNYSPSACDPTKP